MVSPPDLEAVAAAGRRLSDMVVRTPLLPLAGDQALRIHLKPETLQPIGSFKLRGALNWARSLSVEQQQRGFSTHSAGNTALAIGYIARSLGVAAHSLLPDRTPASKIAAIQRAGVAPVTMTMDALLQFIFRAGWNEQPYSYLNPWTDPQMIAGNGTIGLEIHQDMPDLDTVYVPVGGGGLIAGVGSVLKQLRPSVRIVGVQPEACPSLKVSLKADKPLWVESQPTICDTALPLVLDELFPLLRDVVDEVALVSDQAVKQVVVQLARDNKLVVEAAGAMTVAAALNRAADKRGQTVCIVSGGSIGLDKIHQFALESSP